MSTPTSASSGVLNGNLVVELSKDNVLTITKISQGSDDAVPQVYESDVKVILDYVSDKNISELQILNEPSCPKVVNLLIRQLLDCHSRLLTFTFCRNVQYKIESGNKINLSPSLIISYPGGQVMQFYRGMLSANYDINAEILLQAIEQFGGLVAKLNFQHYPDSEILQSIVDKCFSDRHYSRIKSIYISPRMSVDCNYSYDLLNANSSVFLSVHSMCMPLDYLLVILKKSLIQTVGLNVSSIDSLQTAIGLLQWLYTNKKIKVLNLHFSETDFQFSDQDFTRFLTALIENKNLIKLGLRNFLLHTTNQQRFQFFQALSKTNINALNLNSYDKIVGRDAVPLDRNCLIELGRNKKLQNLSMRNCGINGLELKHLSDMSNLISIDLGGVHNYNITAEKYLNGFMSFLKATPSLKKLCLSDFRDCGQTQMHSVANTSGRSRFPGIWSIEHLRLENYNITYQEAEAICDQIVTLELDDCKIDLQGIQAFLRSDSLKFFCTNSPMTLHGVISEEQLLELVEKNNNLLCFYSGCSFGRKEQEACEKHLMENRARLAATISDSTDLPQEILSIIHSYDDPFAEPDWDFYQGANLLYVAVAEQKSTSVDSASVSIVSTQSASSSSYSSSSCNSYSDAKLLATSSIGTLLSASSGSANTSSSSANSSDANAAIISAKLDS